jgi:hypothetical protein
MARSEVESWFSSGGGRAASAAEERIFVMELKPIPSAMAGEQKRKALAFRRWRSGRWALQQSCHMTA